MIDKIIYACYYECAKRRGILGVVRQKKGGPMNFRKFYACVLGGLLATGCVYTLPLNGERAARNQLTAENLMLDLGRVYQGSGSGHWCSRTMSDGTRELRCALYLKEGESLIFPTHTREVRYGLTISRLYSSYRDIRVVYSPTCFGWSVVKFDWPTQTLSCVPITQ